MIQNINQMSAADAIETITARYEDGTYSLDDAIEIAYLKGKTDGSDEINKIWIKTVNAVNA